MKKSGGWILWTVLLILIAAGCFYLMNYLFDHNDFVSELFTGGAKDQVFGKVAPDSGQSIADKERTFGRIAMCIFTAIVLLQFCAFVVAALVVNGVRRGAQATALRLKELENADVFFDVPLYIGLFGTISGFLLMVFSTQSSLVIAYSSTLIGIILSLILRLALLFPLRRKLLYSGGKTK
ncbi:MAG: hypothetical protein LBM70_09485 [Victivallales bacterium]|jgi:hypothetical protein|nr:hypothetical protein [Victivallales bacterium]